MHRHDFQTKISLECNLNQIFDGKFSSRAVASPLRDCDDGNKQTTMEAKHDSYL